MQTTAIEELILSSLGTVNSLVVAGRNTMVNLYMPVLTTIASNLEVVHQSSLQTISMPVLVNLCNQAIVAKCNGSGGISNNPNL